MSTSRWRKAFLRPSTRARSSRSPSRPTYRRRAAGQCPAARSLPRSRYVNPAARRWPTTVGPVHPIEGCTATPTGLSITTMWLVVVQDPDVRRPARRPPRAGRPRAGRPRRAGSPASAGRTWPGVEPSRVHQLLARASPRPRLREMPNIRESPTSTRSPPRPSGISIEGPVTGHLAHEDSSVVWCLGRGTGCRRAGPRAARSSTRARHRRGR